MWQPVLFLKNLAPWQICQSEMENTLTSFGIYWKQLIYVIIVMTSCLLFEFGGGSSMSVRIMLPMRAIVPLRGLFSQCSEWTSSKRCSLSPWVHFTRPPFFFSFYLHFYFFLLCFSLPHFLVHRLPFQCVDNRIKFRLRWKVLRDARIGGCECKLHYVIQDEFQ